MADPRTISVVIPGEPVAQGRGRAFAYQRRDGKMAARVFDPAKSRNWKATAQQHMRLAMLDQVAGTVAPMPPPISGPVRLNIVAIFGCPKSKWKKKTARPAEWKTSRPDLDNVVKAVKDAAKGVLWFDDSQVVSLFAEKYVGAQGEPPMVNLVVVELAELGNGCRT